MNRLGRLRWHSQDLKRLVFGRTKYASREIERRRVDVRMPEGRYPATVVLTEDTWTSKRPVLGRLVSRRVFRAELTPDVPIPHPGKGENSWDQGDDAMYSLVCPAADAREATKKAADSVMRDRWRYGGGYDWVPAKGWLQGVEACPGIGMGRVDRRMGEEQMREALEDARHELTTLHGLYAFDGAAPEERWPIDCSKTLAAIDEALGNSRGAGENSDV